MKKTIAMVLCAALTLTAVSYTHLYQAIAVSCIANVMWTVSIKKGNMLVVVLASNFLPIISTVITAWMLGLNITLPVIAGALLVVCLLYTSWI